MKYVVTIIPLVEFGICSLELDYVSSSHNKCKDLRGNLDK